MQIAEFTLVLPLAGGVLIGTSAALMLWLNGRVAGVSGIVYNVLADVLALKVSNSQLWRYLFVAGLLIGAGCYHLAFAQPIPLFEGVPLSILIGGGLLVGFGTGIGSGCTSGHGVCGIGLLSTRSLMATFTFILFGVLSILAFRHALGWI